MWPAPDPRGEGRQHRVRQVAAGGRVAPDDPGRDPGGGRIGQVGQARVPVAVLEDDRPRRGHVQLDQGLGLGPDVRRRPGRVPCRQVGDRRGEVRAGHLGRVVRHPGDDRQRDGRRIEQDERRRPDPGAGQGRGGHRAPAVADDLELRDVEPHRPDPRGDVGGVVAEAVVTRPVPGQAVPGQVGCDDAPAGRGEGRPDPPPDRGGRGHAVEQHEGTAAGLAPGDRGERDPGGLRHGPLARSDRRRRSEDGPDGRGQIVEAGPDRCGQVVHARTVPAGSGPVTGAPTAPAAAR